jgi:hypothetical protein
VIATRTRRILALAALCIGTVACDHVFFQEPSRYTSVPLALTLMPSAGGQPEAFDKVDRVRVQVTGEDGVRLDTTIAVTPAGQNIQLSIDLDLASPGESLTLQVELRRGAEPLFRASAPIPRGARRNVEIPLTLEPVPAALLLPASVPTVTAYGDTVRINGALVFATGDTVSVGPVQWTSLDPTIIAIDNNAPVARADGSARLVGRSGTLADTVTVRVLATVQTIVIEPVPPTPLPVGQTRQLIARLRDRRGNAIPRSALWTSSNANIITVNETGLASAVGLGSAIITAASGGVSANVTLQAPAGPPGITTDGAVQVGANTATLRATARPNGAATMAWFEFSTSPTLASPRVTQMAQIGSGVAPVTVSAPVTGLTPNTTYYVRAHATSSLGTVNGTIGNFRTTVTPPTVSTSPADIDSDGFVTLNGSVTPNGTPTTAWFEWGQDSSFAPGSYLSTTPVGVGSGNAPVSVGQLLSSVDPYVVYYFRMAASNGSVTVRGSVASFVAFCCQPTL